MLTFAYVGGGGGVKAFAYVIIFSNLIERFREFNLYVPFFLPIKKVNKPHEFAVLWIRSHWYNTIVTTDLFDDHKPLKKCELKQKAFEDLGGIEIDEKCPIKVLQFDPKRAGSRQQK